MTKFVIFLFMEIMSKKANETSHTWTKAKKICGNSCYLGHLPLQKVTGYLFSSRHYQCYKDIPKPHLKKKNKASTRFTG